ncbi:MAG: hypothetical protein ACR2HY_02355 [Acidimicrobiales bacterium]
MVGLAWRWQWARWWRYVRSSASCAAAADPWFVGEYRTLPAATWTDLEGCAHAADHEAGATAAMGAMTDPGDSGPGGQWRHVLLFAEHQPVELSVHAGRAGAAASVAVARATDDEAIHWAEPVLAGPRPTLGSLAEPRDAIS